MEIAPVTRERWDDLAELFVRKGPRGGTPATQYCWCMWWRKRTGDAAQNRRAMRELVRDGREPGLLAYDSATPVGWVSVGPRDEFGQLVRSRTYRPEDEDADADVWSIVCFYVHPSAKRQGVARTLLDAAVEQALGRGAAAVEVYPFARGRDYMGIREQYEAVGFEQVRKAGKRLVMRRAG